MSDLQGRLTEVNPALAQMLGEPAADLVGREVFGFFHPDDAPTIRQQIYERLVHGNEEVMRLEACFRRRDATVGWTTLAVSLVRSAAGAPAYLVAVGEDVTERRRLQSQLHHQAHHDPLTGLPNRTLLYERLKTSLRRGRQDQQIGVCFLDLDHFKAVNDTLGHSVGDRLLVQLADRLGQRVAQAKHFVARVGGDEFVVVAENVQTGELAELAQGLLDSVAEPVWVDGHRLLMSASIGVLERAAGDADPDDLLRVADATLYVAKTDGRGRWALFDRRRHAADLLRYELAASIPDAIAAGQFFLEFQPIVSLADNRIRGMEALVRCRHPDLGVLDPNVFIPVAEQTGAIVALGRWILAEAGL